MTAPLNALLFGSCLVRKPLFTASRIEGGFECEPYGPVPAVHSFGEMTQMIEILRREREVPRELWPLCRMNNRFVRAMRTGDFHKLDVALIEPALPIEMRFRGISISRDGLLIEVLKPIEERGGKPAAKLATRWLRQGLIGMNEQIRAETGEKLLQFIPGTTDADELARAVIRDIEIAKSDLVEGFRKVRSLLDCPLGVAIYVFGYMPDGRIISWPPGFREDVMAAAGQAGLPMFEPTPRVLEFGVARALEDDSRHYAEPFLPVIGKVMIAFARAVKDGTAPPLSQ